MIYDFKNEDIEVIANDIIEKLKTGEYQLVKKGYVATAKSRATYMDELKEEIKTLKATITNLKRKIKHPEEVKIPYHQYDNARKIVDMYRKQHFGKPSNLSELPLSMRAYNALRARVDSIEELKKLSIDDVRKIRNIGEKSLKEIIPFIS